MKVVCVGDCGIDRYLDLGVEHCGGISLNVAVHARRVFPATDRVQLISAVGNDAEGRRVLDFAAAAGVECHLRVLEGRTASQPIRTLPGGDRVFVDYDAGVLASLTLDRRAVRQIATADVVAVPLYVQIEALFEQIIGCDTGGLMVVDFADIADDPRIERVLRYVDRLDIAFFGIAPKDVQLIRELRALAVERDKLFVITLGAAGSVAVGRDREVSCDAIAVNRVVDTTGAGDSFAAGFLAARCHGAGLGESLAAGAERAAAVISRVGAS